MMKWGMEMEMPLRRWRLRPDCAMMRSCMPWPTLPKSDHRICI